MPFWKLNFYRFSETGGEIHIFFAIIDMSNFAEMVYNDHRIAIRYMKDRLVT